MNTPKFNDGQQVTLNHDGYNAIPKGSAGVIEAVGMLRNGHRRYRVNFNGNSVNVFENELTPQ